MDILSLLILWSSLGMAQEGLGVLPRLISFPPGTSMTTSGSVIADEGYTAQTTSSGMTISKVQHYDRSEVNLQIFLEEKKGALSKIVTWDGFNADVAKIGKSGVYSVTVCSVTKGPKDSKKADSCYTVDKLACDEILKMTNSTNFDEVINKIGQCIGMTGAKLDEFKPVITEENDNLKSIEKYLHASHSGSLTSDILDKRTSFGTSTFFTYLYRATELCQRNPSFSDSADPGETPIKFQKQSPVESVQ